MTRQELYTLLANAKDDAARLQVFLQPRSTRYWDVIGGEEIASAKSAWDTFFYAGQPMPGIARVEGMKEAKFDEKNAPGTDGATLTHLGNNSAKVSVKLTLWTEDHFDGFAAFMPRLVAQTGKQRPKAVKVYHPALAAMGINALICQGVGVPELRSPGGALDVKLKFIEFLPPAAVGPVTQKGSIDYTDPKNVKQAIPSNKAPSSNATAKGP